MSNLINFTENLKDSRVNSLLDYINYMHETKNNANINDSLSKCVVICGELFANQVKKGDKSQDDVESFEANLIGEKVFLHAKDLDFANTIVREGNVMALAEYESKVVEQNDVKGLKKVA